KNGDSDFVATFASTSARFNSFLITASNSRSVLARSSINLETVSLRMTFFLKRIRRSESAFGPRKISWALGGLKRILRLSILNIVIVRHIKQHLAIVMKGCDVRILRKQPFVPSNSEVLKGGTGRHCLIFQVQRKDGPDPPWPDEVARRRPSKLAPRHERVLRA